MKSKLTIFLIAVLIIIPLTVLGCKTQDTTELEERIAELEGKLAEAETEVTEEEMPEVEEEAEEEAPVDEEQTDGDADADSDVDVDKEAPTISLAIYEGPTLDGSICYYRVEATVTGSPTVSFSKDDSGGALDSEKVQININNPTDTYTLTATATNSEGSATDSITLSWGCTVPPIAKDVDISADISLSGYIQMEQDASVGSYALVGDNSSNKQMMAYLSFNIDALGDIDGIKIKDVSASIPIDLIIGHPEQVPLAYVVIKVIDYGNSLELVDQFEDGNQVVTLETENPLADFNFSSNILKDELQKAVDIDKKWFQIQVALSWGKANNTLDYYRIPNNQVVLHIKYEIPG